MTLDPSAPLITADLPGIGGRIKVQPADFEVEEVPAYQPSGQGDHLFLWVEKRSVGAEFFLKHIARKLSIPSEEIGTAGLKDRHAITRQMVSVPATCEANLAALDGPLEGGEIRVLSVRRHGNKLKPGHLHGNRFHILVRDTVADAAVRLPALVERVRQKGFPNFYGSQRFGRDSETLRLGMDLLTGKPTRKMGGFLRRLALSAAQSALFNRYVATRLGDGLLHQVITGDVMQKWPFGGLFVAEDLVREQARFEAREILPTGPMFGKKMHPAPRDAAAAREEVVLREASLSAASFHGFGKLLSGTRRYALVFVDDLAGSVEAEGVRFAFTLPAGCYATVLLREMTHAEKMEGEEADVGE